MRHQRHIVRRALSGLLCLGLLCSSAGAADTPAQEERAGLDICVTGALHGQVSGLDPVSGADSGTGYARVASAMAEVRAQAEAVLLLDSGDALGGGLFTGGDGEAAASVVAHALRAIGYDAFLPAGDEYRAEAPLREQLLAGLSAPEGTGEPVTPLLPGAEEDSPSPVFQTFEVTLSRRTFQIGMAAFGASDPQGGLPRAEEAAQAWTALQARVLEEAPCDLVVVLYPGRDLNEFLKAVSGVHLVIGRADEARVWSAPDRDGVPVPCAALNSGVLSRTQVLLDDSGQLSVAESELLPLASYSPDPALEEAAQPALSAARTLAAQTAGRLGGDWDDGADAPYAQTDGADLTARAMRWASGADAALLSPARLGSFALNTLFPDEAALTAPLSVGDCYRLYPHTDSTLCLVELTGAQLRAWLDVCAGRYTAGESGQLSGGKDADALYGLDYELYTGGRAGHRVAGLTWKGQPVQEDQVFRVAVDSCRLSDPEFPAVQVLWSAAEDGRFSAQGGCMPAVLAGYAQSISLLVPRRESTWYIYSGSTYGPLNRLAFITMLYQLAGSPEPSVDASFVDVSGEPAAVWAAECGIASGDGQGQFLPAQSVTREQAAVMIYRFAQSAGLSAPAGGGVSAASLTDYALISTWARPAADFCCRTGILAPVGPSGRLFRPQDTFTRNEARDFLAVLGALLQN